MENTVHNTRCQHQDDSRRSGKLRFVRRLQDTKVGQTIKLEKQQCIRGVAVCS